MTAIIHGMSNAEYHAMPAFSSSGLKLVRRSPAHYWATYRDPARKRKEPTPLMRMGTDWHCALFEPERFQSEYIELPDGLDRRTKEGKQLFAEIEATGKEPLSAEMFEKITSMAAASSQIVEAMRSVGGFAEVSFFWTDEATGLECKARPDFHIPPCEAYPNGYIIDGKSLEDASPEEFGKSAWNAAHHVQAAFYVDAFMAVYGTTEPPVFAWLAQEREAPYACAVYELPAELLALGREMYAESLAIVKVCEQSGKWPAYDTAPQPLQLPSWAKRVIDSMNDGDDVEVIGYV